MNEERTLSVVELVPTARQTKEKENVSLGHLVSGGAAGALSRTITAPLDRLKVLYEVKRVDSRVNSIWRDLIAIGERGGMRSYFRGNGVNIIKIIPKMGIKFYAFELFKNRFSASGDPSVGDRLAAGMAAATIAQVVIHPLDCVKTRVAATEETMVHPVDRLRSSASSAVSEA